MDFFNDIFHNLALLEFYFLNIIYILIYIDFILSIFFQHSNILTRASHHWCLASNIVLVSNDVTTMQLMVVEEHESFMTEYTSHFIHVYIMSTSVCNHINSLRVTWHILTSRSQFWIVLFGEQKLYKTRTTRKPAFWDTPRCLMITHTSEERCTLARAWCVRTRTTGSACRKPFTLVRVLVLNPEKISLAGSYAIWVRRGQNENRTLDLLKIRLSHQI